MRKIPTLFVRDEATNRRYVRNEVHPECQWVLDGAGRATRKYDGTCTRLTNDGLWWARREVKAGKQAPPDFVPEQLDEITGKLVGWEPMENSSFAKFHAEAVKDTEEPGTYELCGPKIQGNPEGYAEHRLVAHKLAQPHPDAPRDFDGLRDWLRSFRGEGIVWHHPDGRMAKLKAKDFPIK